MFHGHDWLSTKPLQTCDQTRQGTSHVEGIFSPVLVLNLGQVYPQTLSMGKQAFWWAQRCATPDRWLYQPGHALQGRWGRLFGDILRKVTRR